MSRHLLATPVTISKIGCRRIPVANGLLQLITRQELRDQVRAFGRLINEQYSGKAITLIPVMHGGAFFYVDLTKQFDDRVADAMDRAIVAQSYGDERFQQRVRLYCDWMTESHIRDRHCLVIDDIFDNGTTAVEVFRKLEEYHPASIELCCLLEKRKERAVQLRPTYSLFEIDDCWVVGYGLDGDGGRYRHLRYVAELPKPQKSR